MKNILLVLATVAVAATFFGLGRQFRSAGEVVDPHRTALSPSVDDEELVSPIPAGMEFPDVALVDREGNHLSLSSLYDGRPLYVLALAAGCRGCRAEIDRWRQEIATLPVDVQVVGLAPESFPDMDEAWGEEPPRFPVYRDAGGTLQSLGVEVVPSGFGLDASGQVLVAHYGIESMPSTRLEALRDRVASTRQESAPLRFETERARSR